METFESHFIEAFDIQVKELCKIFNSIHTLKDMGQAITEMHSNYPIFTTGMGKAGHVARKFSSTLSSLGTPSYFIHPGEAQHGDLGMITYGSILFAFSNSGKTREVVDMVTQAKGVGIATIISITSLRTSPLGKASDLVIDYGEIIEACHLGIAPTTSTTVMQVIADSMAVAISRAKLFSKEDYGKRHHGGYLGRKARS